MARTMADRIGTARRQSFVGRGAELELFDALVAGSPEQGAVVFVHGPAGIGKTTLLRRFAARGQELGVSCLQLDARDLPPALDSLTAGLSAVLDGNDSDDNGSRARTVVLLDGYEMLGALDTAVREQLAPRLPADAILVLAGQQPPSTGWRSDPGWAPLLHVVRLGNLSRAESGAYLSGRDVPSDLHPPAIAFTHGHPLALALVAEVVREKGSLPPSDTADVVRVLIDRLLDAVPSQAHRDALEAAAQVRVTDEPLLAALMDTPDAAELFAWMRGLPFVDTGPSGLSLHDLAREVLAADLRWRHGQRYAELHARARQYYLSRLPNADPATQAVALMDLIYLHPDLRAFLTAPEDAALLRVEAIRGGEEATVLELVARYEGEESAAVARHWLARQPGAWLVVRGPGGDVLGAVCLLALDLLGPRDGQEDPAVAAALAELGSHPPLRPSETATLVRYWISRDHYQSASPVQSVIATLLARHYLTTPGLAVTLLPFAHPQEWEAFCAYADQRRAPQADFTVGGRQYTTFGHDWRTVPPAAWVAKLSLQEVGAAPDATAAAGAVDLLVLGEAEFSKAVRQALRDYTRPDRLRGSPLLRCRLITSAAPGGQPMAQRVGLLKTLLKEAAETLNIAPADRRLHRVVVRAYLAPAPSLERAAEVLELPSSTFRRLLDTACARVATVLWHQELDT